MTDLHAQVTAEISDLHQFFQEWFNGVLPPTAEAFARFRQVMADHFHIIWPDGRALDLPPLSEALFQRHHSHAADQPIRIWIQNTAVRHTTPQTVLATYEEWQQIGNQPSYGRLSTVLFQRQAKAPHGLIWQHVHETWLTPPQTS